MKKYSYLPVGLMCASVLLFNANAFADKSSSPGDLVKNLYTSDLWKNPEDNFHKVFHPEYKQYWHKENKYITYNYKQAYDHTVNDLKNKYANVTFYFSHIISDGNLVLARYVSKKCAKDNPQQCSMTPMMALWEVKDDKLYRCWETSVKPAESEKVFESFPVPQEPLGQHKRENAMSALNLKNLVQEIFKEVVENINATELNYADYFSKDYLQYVDGKTLTYQDFVAHMKAQKQALKSVKIVFHEIIVEGNRVATSHTAYATRKDNKKIEAHVISIFKFKDGKLISCNELTRLEKGGESDRDIGSRY